MFRKWHTERGSLQQNSERPSRKLEGSGSACPTEPGNMLEENDTFSKMVFYETIHSGILRISFNEQYLWHWFRTENIEPPQNLMKILSLRIEGRLNDWNWKKSLTLDEVISSVYYKHTHEKQIWKHQTYHTVFYWRWCVPPNRFGTIMSWIFR